MRKQDHERTNEKQRNKFKYTNAETEATKTKITGKVESDVPKAPDNGAARKRGHDIINEHESESNPRAGTSAGGPALEIHVGFPQLRYD